MCVYSVADCTPLLIQQNDGSGSMNRSRAEYKVGFGERSGNYWLGNDLLSQLTANFRYKLRFDLQQYGTGTWYYAEYSRFRVLPEPYYALKVGGFSGNVSDDAFGRYSNGERFSTFDFDNDRWWTSGNCAAALGGGFWYGVYCAWCPVNGARSAVGFHWSNLEGVNSLQLSRMWLKCK